MSPLTMWTYELSGFDLFLLGSILVLSLALAAGFILGRHGSRTSNLLVATTFFMLGYTNVIYILKNSGALARLPELGLTNFSVRLTIAPLLYLYSLSLIRPGFRIRFFHFVHFLPALIALFFVAPYMFLTSFEAGPLLFSEEFVWSRTSAFAARTTFNLFYFGLIILELKRFRRQLTDEFSNMEGLKLGWLNLLVWVSVITWQVKAIYFVMVHRGTLGGARSILDFGDSLILVISLLVLVVVGLRQSSITNLVQSQGLELDPAKLNERDATESNLVQLIKDPVLEVAPPSPPPLNAKYLDMVAKKIDEGMRDDRLYLNPTLKLHDLAQKIQVPAYLVSHTLNHRLNKTFYEYVNEFRVAAAKSKLTDASMRSMTILALAEESGFNSKSVFNDVFKKMTGLTPSQFRANGSNQTLKAESN